MEIMIVKVMVTTTLVKLAEIVIAANGAMHKADSGGVSKIGSSGSKESGRLYTLQDERRVFGFKRTLQARLC